MPSAKKNRSFSATRKENRAKEGHTYASQRYNNRRAEEVERMMSAARKRIANATKRQSGGRRKTRRGTRRH